MHKISKYSGKDGAVPKIYKLGSVAWKKLKTKTKKRVKEIAFDLIQVYAKRKLKKGFQETVGNGNVFLYKCAKIKIKSHTNHTVLCALRDDLKAHNLSLLLQSAQP